MWALLGAAGAFMERGRGDGQGGQGEWAVVDDEGLAQITQMRFLISDSTTMSNVCVCHLVDLGRTTGRPAISNEILQKDQKYLAIIIGSEGMSKRR